MDGFLGVSVVFFIRFLVSISTIKEYIYLPPNNNESSIASRYLWFDFYNLFFDKYTFTYSIKVFCCILLALFPNHFIMADTTRGEHTSPNKETPAPTGAPVPPKK